MTTGQRTYGALAVLMVASGGLYLSQKRAQASAEAHSLRAQSAAIPNLGLVAADSERIDRLELTKPASGDAPAQRISLEKRGAGWRITVPVDSMASLSKVQALLDNLASLKLSESVDSGEGYYERYGLTEANAFHVVAWRGSVKVAELYFGKSSARGQFVRVAGTEGVFTVDSEGSGSYSGFLYTRPLRAWRETSILQFDPAAVAAVHIDNRFGRFSFLRWGDTWSCSDALRARDGSLSGPEKPWKECDSSKVASLLDAFKSLSADEFGGQEDRAGSGLDQAEPTGGVIRIELGAPRRELAVRIGSVARGPSDWAIKDSRWASDANGDGTLYALACWTTDWVTNGASQFERSRRAVATAR